MPAVATPPRHRAQRRGHAPDSSEPGRATLDDRIALLWTQLVERGTADCPVCRAELAAGAPCRSCGSELT